MSAGRSFVGVLEVMSGPGARPEAGDSCYVKAFRIAPGRLAGPRGGVVTQRIANPCIPVRFRTWPPTLLPSSDDTPARQAVPAALVLTRDPAIGPVEMASRAGAGVAVAVGERPRSAPPVAGCCLPCRRGIWR